MRVQKTSSVQPGQLIYESDNANYQQHCNTNVNMPSISALLDSHPKTLEWHRDLDENLLLSGQDSFYWDINAPIGLDPAKGEYFDDSIITTLLDAEVKAIILTNYCLINSEYEKP